MKVLRPILLAIVVTAAFYFFTSHRAAVSPARWVTRSQKVELTEAAGPVALDPEEQVNIDVYRKALPAVVNIKSTAVAFDFFYGMVQEEGKGKGGKIDSE